LRATQHSKTSNKRQDILAFFFAWTCAAEKDIIFLGFEGREERMRQVEVMAHAKINLSLDVKDMRSDGYHNISSVMQSIGLSDRIVISKTSGSFEFMTNKNNLPADSRNLAYKAAQAICAYAKIQPSVRIDLHKSIPIGAGLAGGSTDAAGTLIAMNMLFDLQLSETELFQLALDLGSDVPFCLRGGTFLAEGRGEVLSQICSPVRSRLMLYKPPFSVSTAAVYRRFKSSAVVRRPDNGKLIAALEKGCFEEGFIHMINVLESVTLDRRPQLAKAKEIFMNEGADHVLMSGSGPTLLAFYQSDTQQESLRQAVKVLPGRGYLTEFFHTAQEIRKR
jgi:4-diphosphocytidyl-2-C-methyl-D-erythritol kinase